MPFFKVWSADKVTRKAVIAEDYSELVIKGKEKLGFTKEEEVVIVTADDETEVEADTFKEFPPSTIFIMKTKVPRDNIEDVQTIKKAKAKAKQEDDDLKELEAWAS